MSVITLTDLDFELLEVICHLRVVTQTQLERLHPDVPARTLRYRTRRLHELGLLGRVRPYRERGSAPTHLWPTHRADGLVAPSPGARRGAREAPSPLFVAHAAALSGLYISLRTRLSHTGMSLVGFLREGDARHDFRDEAGQRRAIAPDARIAVADRTGSVMAGHVELDLGTMSHARLRAKVEGYLAHAKQSSQPPTPLLLLTCSSGRADRFLEAAHRRMTSDSASLAVAASPHARDTDRAILDRSWATTDDPESRRLADVLRSLATAAQA